MKKLYRIFAAAALLLTSVACVEEQYIAPSEDLYFGENVVISAALPSSSDTRVSYNMDAASKLMKTSWEAGDVIYYTTGSGSGTAFTQTGPISEDGKFTQFENSSVKLSANKEMLFTYPVSYKTSSSGNLRIYAHDGTIENIMKDMDYLYGYAKTDANKVIPNIEFDRLSAFLEIKDLSFPADANVTITRIYVMSGSMGNRAYLDISSKKITVYRDATMVINPVDYKIVNGKVEGDKVLYAAFFPTAEAAAGDECSLMFQAEDGTMYEKKWKAGSVYSAGNMYSVTGEVVKPVTFNIQFEDPVVREILTSEWYGCDKNGDGELSNVEASLITTLNWMFYQNPNIEKFNEFVYFTGVSTFIGSNSTGGGGFFECTKLKEITLPPSVNVIGSDAFNGCTSLETFNVPETVQKINAGAFRNCTALKNITIPATVSYMGEGQTFRGCTALKTVEWPAATTTIPGSTFMDSGLENFTIPANITEIGASAFENCTGLKSIAIPSSVKTIGQKAFKGCTGISTFTIPSGVEKINNEAFYGTSATTFSLPATVTTIGQKAFNANPGITKFTIEEGSAYSVSEDVSMIIKTSADIVEAVNFFGNKSEVVFPENVSKIGNSFAQGASNLEKVSIPAVTSLGSSAFADCPKLTTATYAAEATTTGNNTFQNCTALENITLPTAITQLGSNLFSGCTSLKSVVIPDSVTKINSGVFTNTAIEELVLPASLTEIVNNLFSGCKSLKNITIPESVKKIGQNAFKDCVSLTKIDIPASVTSFGNSAFNGCTGLTEIKLPSGITTIPNSFIFGCTGIKSIDLPESVTTIQANAFKGSGLTGITFPAKVTKIESGLFENCADLKTLVVPETITTIGSNAFKASGLESIKLPATVKKIDMSTFEDCASLKSIEMPGVTSFGNNPFKNCTALETITVPEGVTSISTWCFQGCSALKTVNLPSTLKSFSTWAFQDCKSLKSITVPANVTSWGSSTFEGCTSLVEVIVLSTTPSSISATVFPFETNDELVIYVPDSAIEAYKAHEAWSAEGFAGRIFAMSTRE